MIRAKNAFPTKARSQWALEWPGQTVLCVSKLYWTADITDKLSKNSKNLRDYIETCTYELNEIVKLVRGKLSSQNRTTLGQYFVWQELNISVIRIQKLLFSSYFYNAEAVVTLDVHSRDVLVQLCEQNVNQITDFKWLCQLRYYWIVSTFKYAVILFSLFIIYIYICYRIIYIQCRQYENVYFCSIGRLVYNDDKF